MEKKTLVIAEMLHENIPNGVNRYSEMLLSGLSEENYHIIYLKLVFYKRVAFPYKNKHGKYLELVVPIPINSTEIINNDYWNAEYNMLIEHLISPYLASGFIMHIQTMNLINLALFLRIKYHCKIVSHIHCIPWKYSYSSNQQLFNKIYQTLNLLPKGKRDMDSKCFISKNESNIMKESDAIICVTKAARKYYQNFFPSDANKIHCVYNGIRDDFSFSRFTNLHILSNTTSKPIRLLYVGNVTRNKGFHFILETLKIVHEEGYKFILYVAGAIDHTMQNLIKSEYKQLNIKLFGKTDYSKLKNLYETSHIGLISSLFEQCSYVALEMSMFGLPVIHTNIKELREIFGTEKSMSVSVDFTTHSSLTINIKEFASRIITLINSSSLRKKNGLSIRNRYCMYFRLEDMIQKTIEIYNSI